MTAPLSCPGAEGWQVLFNDSAPAEERERYERHLETCRDCQARLDTAEGQPEMLRRIGREVGDPTHVVFDPALTQVMERLLESKPSTGTADLSFLRPTAREGLLGTLGDYEVTEVIGRGGMGIVLKAYEPALG